MAGPPARRGPLRLAGSGRPPQPCASPAENAPLGTPLLKVVRPPSPAGREAGEAREHHIGEGGTLPARPGRSPPAVASHPRPCRLPRATGAAAGSAVVSEAAVAAAVAAAVEVVAAVRVAIVVPATGARGAAPAGIRPPSRVPPGAAAAAASAQVAVAPAPAGEPRPPIPRAPQQAGPPIPGLAATGHPLARRGQGGAAATRPLAPTACRHPRRGGEPAAVATEELAPTARQRPQRAAAGGDGPQGKQNSRRPPPRAAPRRAHGGEVATPPPDRKSVV